MKPIAPITSKGMINPPHSKRKAPIAGPVDIICIKTQNITLEIYQLVPRVIPTPNAISVEDITRPALFGNSFKSMLKPEQLNKTSADPFIAL